MSFASLKSQRQAKSSRSYATSADNSRGSHHTTIPNVAHSNDPGQSTPDNVGTVYQGMPNNVEMRVSSVSGRGLFAKDPIQAGS